jgi:hypothetical protein
MSKVGGVHPAGPPQDCDPHGRVRTSGWQDAGDPESGCRVWYWTPGVPSEEHTWEHWVHWDSDGEAYWQVGAQEIVPQARDCTSSS